MAADNKDEQKIVAELAKLSKAFKDEAKNAGKDVKQAEKLVKELLKQAKG